MARGPYDSTYPPDLKMGRRDLDGLFDCSFVAADTLLPRAEAFDKLGNSLSLHWVQHAKLPALGGSAKLLMMRPATRRQIGAHL